jgi:hypothetical protein
MIWSKNMPKPTKAEQTRINLIMSMSCCVCALHGDVSKRALECHHIVRGGKRLGHWYTLQICRGHHRGIWDERSPQPAQISIADGSKAFRAAHGGLDDLQIWQRQQFVLGLDDSLPATKILPRRHVPQTEAQRLTTTGESQ